MASLLFGGAIDYARVRVHNRPYLPFGLRALPLVVTVPPSS